MQQDHLEDVLGAERYERVVTLANERHVTVDDIVREAIDRGLPASASRRRAAAEAILAAEPMPVGSVDELLEELDRSRGRWA
ncbi:hypothetical protein [Murinocardiopsis flavida]|uniref:hypothetical protein n=1 Tax=Murinocardiopsis flavida TaxID=645275 RepID=UPI000D0DD550|nr:hypothetical protein [Murinocardiopsis flavida]